MLKVSIVYGDLKADFEGEPDQVYREVVRFLEKTIPAYSFASKLSKVTGIEEALDKLKNWLGYDTSSGLFLKADLTKIPTSTAILLFGALKHFNHVMGHVNSSEFLSSEVADFLGRPEKTVSGRLTELVKKGLLKRVGRGGYCLTPTGLSYLVESSPDT
ncbi:MAG: hypothetical protein QXF45_04005 [Candidatus Caldarchaeum sp.]